MVISPDYKMTYVSLIVQFVSTGSRMGASASPECYLQNKYRHYTIVKARTRSYLMRLLCPHMGEGRLRRTTTRDAPFPQSIVFLQPGWRECDI